MHCALTISTWVLSRSLEQYVVEVRQGGLQFEGLLRLLHHVHALTPPVGRVELAQVLGHELMGLDAVGVDTDYPRTLGMDAEHVRGVITDRVFQRRGVLGVQLENRRVLQMIGHHRIGQFIEGESDLRREGLC